MDALTFARALRDRSASDDKDLLIAAASGSDVGAAAAALVALWGPRSSALA